MGSHRNNQEVVIIAMICVPGHLFYPMSIDRISYLSYDIIAYLVAQKNSSRLLMRRLYPGGRVWSLPAKVGEKHSCHFHRIRSKANGNTIRERLCTTHIALFQIVVPCFKFRKPNAQCTPRSCRIGIFQSLKSGKSTCSRAGRTC